MKPLNKRKTVGWVAVGLSIALTCLWAFWGIIENFHEGWYYESWLSNIGLMFLQYLSPMLLFMAVTLVSIFWPRIGGTLHLIVAGAALWFFNARTNPAAFLIILPLIGFGLLYWFGRPQPRRLAASLAVGLPLLTLVIFGLEPAYRVSQRLDDGNLQARRVQGNGVILTWAPAGPGWPPAGTNWPEAQRSCQFLGQDGLTIAAEPQNIWRLPTVDEAVRSMARNRQNCGGVWDTETATAVYETTPDKESPLWNVHSQVIYWWTATEIDAEHAYMIAYNGKVWPRTKQQDLDYLGYRCVK